MGDVLPPGTRLGRYEIVQRLALGGMAEIYLARMSGLAGFAKHVVLKRILPSHARDSEFVRMFFNEARYAATLDHPNIAHVYDLGEEQGLHYFTMEYLHGEDCRTLLRELTQRNVTLPLEHALTVVVGAAAGCHFAHELNDDDGKPLGLIHRDVSPSNVVVTYAGAVKLVDFGIAKATNLEDVTAIGVTKGKLAYMAPEQCRGESLDRRVDVYALGVLLYELTTQRRAFAGQNDASVMWAVISGEVPTPSSHVPGFPPVLEAIILRAMDTDRTRRFATARELSQAVEAFARESGLTINPAALGEFIERTMGPKLEPWRTADRGDGKPGRSKTPPPVSALSATLPAGGDADTPTFAPARTPAGPLPRATSTLTVASSPSGETAPSRDAETVAELAVTTARARPTGAGGSPPRSPWFVVGLATAGAVGLVAAALVWRGGREDGRDDARITLIAERGRASIEGTDDPPPAADGGAGGAAAGPADAAAASIAVDARAAVRPPRPPRPSDPLSEAFERRNAQVLGCVARHSPATRPPPLRLRFEIDVAGTPTKVDVLPPELGRTALGACIADVGRGTRFPPQPAPAAFSIPVSFSTSGGN